MIKYKLRANKMLGEKDSNPHKQNQNLPCYHYTIPQLILNLFIQFLKVKIKVFLHAQQKEGAELFF